MGKFGNVWDERRRGILNILDLDYVLFLSECLEIHRDDLNNLGTHRYF